MIPDMTCGGCVNSITRALQKKDSAAQVEANVPEHRVTIRSSLQPNEVIETIVAAGFNPQEMR
jgi:copper chaperone